MLTNPDAKQATSDVSALSDWLWGRKGRYLSQALIVVADVPQWSPESPGGLLKYKVLSPPPEFRYQLAWEEPISSCCCCWPD